MTITSSHSMNWLAVNTLINTASSMYIWMITTLNELINVGIEIGLSFPSLAMVYLLWFTFYYIAYW